MPGILLQHIIPLSLFYKAALFFFRQTWGSSPLCHFAKLRRSSNLSGCLSLGLEFRLKSTIALKQK